MKHLILGGGYLNKAADGGNRWVETLLARTDKEARIAFCLFSRDEHEWVHVLQQQQTIIKQFAGKTRLEFQTMTPSTISKVSEWANVIYITGGDFPARLKSVLQSHGGILELWDDKTICGSSAGANVMCKRYMHLQNKQVEEGLGWVNARLIPHWRAPDWPGWTDADWSWAVEQLVDKAGGSPLLCLPEGDFLEIKVK